METEDSASLRRRLQFMGSMREMLRKILSLLYTGDHSDRLPYNLGTSELKRTVSDLQKTAGWAKRTRSVSMNAMAGNAGEFTSGGTNINNPTYRQFFSLTDIPAPSQIFVFIEEHPDSINDGYFLNKMENLEWTDLPASYHDGSVQLAYADGHVESHRWRCPSTKPKSKPDAAKLPFRLPASEHADFYWLMSRTSREGDGPR